MNTLVVKKSIIPLLLIVHGMICLMDCFSAFYPLGELFMKYLPMGIAVFIFFGVAQILIGSYMIFGNWNLDERLVVNILFIGAVLVTIFILFIWFLYALSGSYSRY